jgi:hypothetical protein
LKVETLNRTLWRARFRRGYGPVAGQPTEWMNECMNEWMLTVRATCCNKEALHVATQSIHLLRVWVWQRCSWGFRSSVT